MVASLAAIAIVLASFGAAGAAAQSAGDRQYADPLAGGGQQERSRTPAPESGDAPSAPVPAPAPASPAPSGSAADTTGYGTATPAPASGETLPHTGAEPVPIVATGLLLLLGGGLLRQRTLRRAAS